MENAQTHFTAIQKSENRLYYWMFTLFLLAFAIFYLRDSVTYRNPILYTEDGVWLGMINEHGFWHTFFNARRDYFVALNLIILEAANLANGLLFGGSLLAYPTVLAVLVNVWYAGVVSLPAVLYFRYLTPCGWIIFVSCLALLPFGHTAYEILAKASNVGFSTFYVAMFCIAYRTFTPSRAKLKTWLIDGMIILSVLTNPLVLGLYPLLLSSSWKAWRSGTKVRDLIKDDLSMVVLLLFTGLIVAAFVYRYQAVPLIGQALAQKTPITLTKSITYGFGRSLLYPFTSLIYPLINNFLAVLSSFFIFWAIYRCIRQDREIKSIIWVILGSWLAVTLAAGALRPGLIEMLSSYHATNPDRYVITQNILILSAVLFVFLRHLTRSPKLSGFSIGCILLIGSYVTQAVAVSWIEQARPPYETYLGSQQQLMLSAAENAPENTPASGFVSMPIYFLGWSMRERFDRLEKLSTCCNKEISLTGSPRWTHDVKEADRNWTITGGDPMLYWLFETPIPVDRLPIVKFKFSCPNPTAEWSVIGVYWLDSAGNAAGDRAFTFKAKPGWQVIPLDELKNYRGDIGGLRLDMESTDTCKTYNFEQIDFYDWKAGHSPFVPKLPMPWTDGLPRALLERLHSTMGF